MFIDASTIADSVAAGLALAATVFDDEQSVTGIDALDEVALHPYLADWLRRDGYGVHREERYPGDRHKRSRAEGERCDLVLTPDGRALRAPDVEPQLFDPPDALPLDEAYWLEVKVIHQFLPGRANPGYTSRLKRPAGQDVIKLSKDPDILRGGLLQLLFALNQDVAAHDLAVWLDHAIQIGLPVAGPSLRFVEINDRMGHGVCGVAVYPVSRL